MSKDPLRKIIEAEQKAHEELASAYRWKSENIVRFFDNLGMTTEQKVDLLADEFADMHRVAVIRDRNSGWYMHGKGSK